MKTKRCKCCEAEIPEEFLTEFCDACHNPYKLRQLIESLKKELAELRALIAR